MVNRPDLCLEFVNTRYWRGQESPTETLNSVEDLGAWTAANVAKEARPLSRREFERAIEANPPPAPGGKRIKLRYITQVKARPPSFVVFGTRVDQLPTSYQRYLLNSMRRDMKLAPVPMRLTFRAAKNPYDKGR